MALAAVGCMPWLELLFDVLQPFRCSRSFCLVGVLRLMGVWGGLPDRCDAMVS